MEGSLIKKFVDQWIHDTDCFIGLHDRKVCVLGLCLLITMPEVPGLEENSDKVNIKLQLNHNYFFDCLSHRFLFFTSRSYRVLYFFLMG